MPKIAALKTETIHRKWRRIHEKLISTIYSEFESKIDWVFSFVVVDGRVAVSLRFVRILNSVFPFEIPFDTFKLDKRNWFDCCVAFFSFHRWRFSSSVAIWTTFAKCSSLFWCTARTFPLPSSMPLVPSFSSFASRLQSMLESIHMLCWRISHLHFNQKKKIEANERTNGNEKKKIEFHLN